MPLESLLRLASGRVEAALGRKLPPADRPPARLHNAMRYASLDGGKRVRPALVYATGGLFGVAPEALDAPACAVELIHAYSLVHDDLPAMDDDELRRGRPTCHIAFDEATAILAGDALQTLAFEVLATDTAMAVDPATRVRMIARLAHASGAAGMAGGQALDMDATGRALTLSELETLHRHKTGALIRASVALGALSAESVPPASMDLLETYADAIGLAFQIRDDILDVEGETAVMGKSQGSDENRDKVTYTRLLGLAGAKDKAAEMHAVARGALEPFGAAAEPLRALADFIVERSK